MAAVVGGRLARKDSGLGARDAVAEVVVVVEVTTREEVAER